MKTFLTLLPFLLLFTGSQSREIKIFNYCEFPTWAAIQGPGNPGNGGFKLESMQTEIIFVDDDWTGGKIWPMTGCNKTMECATGNLNGSTPQPPYTLAEITLGGDNALDFYSVTLANGYNVPVLIDAYQGAGSCGRAGGCVEDPNKECSKKGKVIRGGWTVGCKSDCQGRPVSKCRDSRMFKEYCPDSYANEFDDKSLTKTCFDATYVVQFC